MLTIVEYVNVVAYVNYIDKKKSKLWKVSSGTTIFNNPVEDIRTNQEICSVMEVNLGDFFFFFQRERVKESMSVRGGSEGEEERET